MKPDHIFIAIREKPLEMAAIRTSPKGDILVAAADATDIQKSFSDIILSSRFDEKYILVAHHAEHVKKLLDVPSKRAWICTAQLAWPLVYNDMLASRTLDSTAKYHGILQEGTTVADEATTTMQLYWEMMRRYKLALSGEEFLRNVGGPKLDTLRRFVGL